MGRNGPAGDRCRLRRRWLRFASSGDAFGNGRSDRYPDHDAGHNGIAGATECDPDEYVSYESDGDAVTGAEPEPHTPDASE